MDDRIVVDGTTLLNASERYSTMIQRLLNWHLPLTAHRARCAGRVIFIDFRSGFASSTSRRLQRTRSHAILPHHTCSQNPSPHTATIRNTSIHLVDKQKPDILSTFQYEIPVICNLRCPFPWQCSRGANGMYIASRREIIRPMCDNGALTSVVLYSSRKMIFLRHVPNGLGQWSSSWLRWRND